MNTRPDVTAHGPKKFEFDMRIPVATIISVFVSLITVVWLVSGFKATQDALNENFERRLSKLEDFVDGVQTQLESIRTDMAVTKSIVGALSTGISNLDAKVERVLEELRTQNADERVR